MGRKLTTEEFIEKAIKVHGSKYDYSLVNYSGAGDKVQIICSTHGVFEQRANDHLQGKGCSRCAAEASRKSCEDFIKMAKEVHGKEKFDYSLVEYKTLKSKVIIVCKKHGEFLQTPLIHLQGHGCQLCHEDGKRYGLSGKSFIESATKVHGNLYIYDLVEYVNISTKVTIICKKHGAFEQSPRLHLNGNGCPRCRQYNRLSQIEFIEKSTLIHDNKYSYDLVEYKSGKRHVKIICPEHGVFAQVAKDHLKGHGCPFCSKKGFDVGKRGFVYILQSADMLKVGITNNKPEKRATQINNTSPQHFDVVFSRRMRGYIAASVERKLIQWLRKVGHKQPIGRFDGYTECFHHDAIILPQVIDKVFELEYCATSEQSRCPSFSGNALICPSHNSGQ